MNTQQHNSTQDHMKIGRFQSSMEDGKLKLYYHEFGMPGGMYCTLSAEEARGMLELLSRHREDIDHALSVNEHTHATASSHIG